jgi:hypothetical protein
MHHEELSNTEQCINATQKTQVRQRDVTQGERLIGAISRIDSLILFQPYASQTLKRMALTPL